MKCQKCGEELIPGNSFCTNCGVGISQQQLNQQPTQPVYQQPVQPVYQQPVQTVNQPYQTPVPTQTPLYNGQTVNQPLPVYKYIQNQPIEDESKPNQLCILSLALRYGVPVVLALIRTAITNDSENIGTYIYAFASLSAPICSLAAFVIMVLVRVKYPKNKFGKILMWIYIIYIALYVITFVVAMIACMSCASAYS